MMAAFDIGFGATLGVISAIGVFYGLITISNAILGPVVRWIERV